MITANLIGGLANQMFQYAFGRALSLELNQELTLDISNFKNYKLHNGFELDKVFFIPAKIASKSDIKRILGLQRLLIIQKILSRPEFYRFASNSFINEDNYSQRTHLSLEEEYYIKGYWQSEDYFFKYSNDIRHDFLFKNKLMLKNDVTYKQIKSCNSVSLHVRRGDYLTIPEFANKYYICPEDYYYKAINLIKTKIENPHFFIFSDSMDWVKDKLIIDSPHTYVTNNSALEGHFDMQLMSSCMHNIIANSSFSWWGAWLNLNTNKIVISPKRWFLNDHVSSKLIPDTWMQI
jgi:hypothetical protein